MKQINTLNSRRNFIKGTAIIAGAMTCTLTTFADTSKIPYQEELPNVLGPRAGYSPQIGTLVSMMTWMRKTILSPVKNMTVEELDYLHDSKSNTIGAMLLHLAATERFYQIHTFEGKKWGDFPKQDMDRFGTASELGNKGRENIKGNKLEFYLDTLKEIRENTLASFKQKDDAWLMAVDKNFPWGPTNNYCKWFHVCEHESNHNGQVKWIKSRLPGSKSEE